MDGSNGWVEWMDEWVNIMDGWNEWMTGMDGWKWVDGIYKLNGWMEWMDVDILNE